MWYVRVQYIMRIMQMALALLRSDVFWFGLNLSIIPQDFIHAKGGIITLQP